jgi:hypothetical protein
MVMDREEDIITEVLTIIIIQVTIMDIVISGIYYQRRKQIFVSFFDLDDPGFKN